MRGVKAVSCIPISDISIVYRGSGSSTAQVPPAKATVVVTSRSSSPETNPVRTRRLSTSSPQPGLLSALTALTTSPQAAPVGCLPAVLAVVVMMMPYSQHRPQDRALRRVLGRPLNYDGLLRLPLHHHHRRRHGVRGLRHHCRYHHRVRGVHSAHHHLWRREGACDGCGKGRRARNGWKTNIMLRREGARVRGEGAKKGKEGIYTRRTYSNERVLGDRCVLSNLCARVYVKNEAKNGAKQRTHQAGKACNRRMGPWSYDKKNDDSTIGVIGAWGNTRLSNVNTVTTLRVYGIRRISLSTALSDAQ